MAIIANLNVLLTHRSISQIKVTVTIDANGILNIFTGKKHTGKSNKIVITCNKCFFVNGVR